MKQALGIGLAVLILLGILAFRLWSALQRRRPGEGDPDLLERWGRHVMRGGDEHWPPTR
ncbi:MAG: hypothetical protein ABSE52_06690 [Candidatus Dormibacteria bacterium]|jgi:hypothetical protein